MKQKEGQTKEEEKKDGKDEQAQAFFVASYLSLDTELSNLVMLSTSESANVSLAVKTPSTAPFVPFCSRKKERISSLSQRKARTVTKDTCFASILDSCRKTVSGISHVFFRIALFESVKQLNPKCSHILFSI